MISVLLIENWKRAPILWHVYIRKIYSHACALLLVPSAEIFKFCIRKYTVGFVKIYSNWNIIFFFIWKSAANMPINKCSSFCDPCECVNHVFVFDFGCCLIKNAWFSVLYRKSIAVSYTHLRAHETLTDLVCRLLL